MQYTEKTISKKSVFQGNIIKVESVTVELPDGRSATRDVVVHPGASAVVPITDSGEIYMVRQYRKPIDRVSLEIPAGKLDEGEKPEECALRELKEETGLTAGNLQHLLSIHSTPGFCNEILHIYAATGLKEGDSKSDDDEFISVEKIPIPRLVEMVHANEITDAKSVIGILLAEKIFRGDINL